MIKTIIFLLLSITLYGTDIPLDKVQKHTFLQKITVNSQIIRLSNAKQAVMSLVDGHIEKYFVKEGEKVSLHQKIALINSITLSRMTSEFLSLQKQFRALNKNYLATKELYLKGLASLQTLNEQSSAKDALLSQLDTLTSQLQTLGIDTKKLTRPASGYILKAHSSGIVAKISEPLHAVISKESKIIEIVKERSFFLKSFVPLKYAKLIRKAQKATLHYLGEEIPLHITKILPNIDEYTQRIVILSSIENNQSTLFSGAFVPATIYIPPFKSYPSVKKSALSFYNNEWVVFIPKTDHEEEEHYEKHKHKIDEHQAEDEHGHEAHEEPHFEARVVRIITEDDHFAAIEGLNEGEKYVSDKSYYVKSLLLKSALGGHGH